MTRRLLAALVAAWVGLACATAGTEPLLAPQPGYPCDSCGGDDPRCPQGACWFLGEPGSPSAAMGAQWKPARP